MTIMGIPSDRFLEDNVSMDQLSMPDFHELKMRVLDSATDREAISIIETFIKRRLYNHDTDIYLKPLQRVCQEIALHPDINMDRLSDIACMSELSLSTTVPDTFTCATALTATKRNSKYMKNRVIGRVDSLFLLCLAVALSSQRLWVFII